jgi:uncharacterized PurR-regulated membrane protein YhhQ (DUF165 family)
MVDEDLKETVDTRTIRNPFFGLSLFCVFVLLKPNKLVSFRVQRSGFKGSWLTGTIWALIGFYLTTCLHMIYAKNLQYSIVMVS